MAPPSSGGVAMIEMLNILEGFDLKAAGHNSPRYLHLLTESMRRAFLDRARYVGDPDFVQVPVDKLTSKAYADELRKTIQLDRASPSRAGAGRRRAREPGDDALLGGRPNGMAVSVTYTLESGLRAWRRGGGRRLPAQQRDGRLQRQARAHRQHGPHRHAGQRRASRQAHAVQHDAVHHRQGRQAGGGDRQPGRAHDHQHGACRWRSTSWRSACRSRRR